LTVTVHRDHAYEGSYFLVDLSGGDGSTAFRSVELPVASTDVVMSRSGTDRTVEAQKRPGLVSYSNLVLVRGLTGRTDLFEWWEQMRAGAADVRRDVTVSLTDERHDAVWTWRFTDAFPAVYRFSALDADGSDLVDEVLELAFSRMSIA
jgi:phage tail-like protein